jgi:ribonuclease HII
MGMNFSEIKRLNNLCFCEDELYCMGYDLIAGVDEVGKGSLAGPMVAAAVILDRKKLLIEKINDSKKLSPAEREQLFEKITDSCISWSIAEISPEDIDKYKVTVANIMVFDMAATGLKVKPDIIISDFINISSEILASSSKTGFLPILKGDQRSISIAAASIIAKVTRDRMMKKIATSFPGYGFDHNMGYGTREHLSSIKKYGPTSVHRMSFRGVKDFRDEPFLE